MHDPLNPDAAQIARHYRAALDSVNLINRLIEKNPRTSEDDATIYRNVQHLQIMRAKTFWTNEDMKPFDDAIKAGDPQGRIL